MSPHLRARSPRCCPMGSPLPGVWQRAPLGPGLPLGEVHVWQANVDGWQGDNGGLTNDEAARAARFRFERDRRRWVAARTLVRRVLARYLGVASRAIALGADENG